MVKVSPLSLFLLLFVHVPFVQSLSASKSTTVASVPATASLKSVSKEAVVVGGGPVGLAASLVLSNPPHCYNVTLLEKADAVATYDPTRAYLYNVNPRGLSMLDKIPRAMEKLEERGSAPSQGMGSIIYIPADPDTPIQPLQATTMSGSKQPMSARRNFWIPRHQMVELLEECCQEHDKARVENKDGTLLGSIQIIRKGFEEISTGDNDELIVKCTDGSTYNAALVVAADGVDSAVRSRLADDTNNHESSTEWLHSQPKQFRVRKYRSPATGLKMKSLQFPPNFTLTNTTGEKIPTESETMYVFRGKNKGTRNRLSLGFLPVKDPNLVRPGNTNTRYNHEIWSLQSGPAAKEFFQKNFPRVKWEELVEDKEWDRYAKAKGTTFPYCQYSPGSAVTSPTGESGVALVGDACHAFPPDIGQGINAGLQDVMALDRALRGEDITTGEALQTAETPKTLGDALAAYQLNRGPEHKALINIARCGAPYQYKQTWVRDRIGLFLWTVNVVFRLMLNKVSGGRIPPSAMLVLQDHSLTYRQVYRRAALTNRVIKLIALGLGVLLWKRLHVVV